MLRNRHKWVIRSVVVLAVLAGLLTAAGCGEIEWWWGGQPGRRIHPANERAHTGHRGPGAGEATGTPVRPGAGFRQLVLVSDASSEEAPPGLKQVQLRRASAREVGELLGVLYVPAGAVGTIERYTLVYPSWRECNAAAEAARDLDVPMVKESPDRGPDDAKGAFGLAIGLLYGTPRGHPQEAARLGRAEASLVRTLSAPAQPARRRWAAGMIAASTRANRLNDYDQAQAHLLEASKVVEPQSLEHLATLYAQARVSIQNGKPDAARETLRKLIDTFGTFKATEVFGRARDTLTELERKQTR